MFAVVADGQIITDTDTDTDTHTHSLSHLAPMAAVTWPVRHATLQCSPFATHASPKVFFDYLLLLCVHVFLLYSAFMSLLLCLSV